MGDIDAHHDSHPDLRSLFVVGIKGLYWALRSHGWIRHAGKYFADDVFASRQKGGGGRGGGDSSGRGGGGSGGGSSRRREGDHPRSTRARSDAGSHSSPPSAMSPLSEVPSTSARVDHPASAVVPIARSAVAAVSAAIGMPPATLHTAGSRRVRAILDAAAQYTALDIPAGISGMLAVASVAAAALLLGQAHCSLIITTSIPIVARYGIALACPKDVPTATPEEQTWERAVVAAIAALRCTIPCVTTSSSSLALRSEVVRGRA